MNKIFDYFVGVCVCAGVMLYCITAEFILLFKDE